MTKWGENVYYKPTYIYEFYLTYGCTIKLEGLDYVEAMVRLQISYNDFFSQIGTSTFINKFASVLGITQDTIRIVSIYEGSTVVYFGVTASSTTSSDTTKQLAQVNDQFSYLCANGDLRLGVSVLDCSSQMIFSTRKVTTIDSGNYKKKEINYAVYVVFAFAALATAFTILIGTIKALKVAKAYKEVANLDTSENDYQVAKS